MFVRWLAKRRNRSKIEAPEASSSTVLIIGADMLLRVYRGNGKAALQGPVVWLCVWTRVYLFVWFDVWLFEGKGKPTPGKRLGERDVDWCEEMCSVSRNRLWQSQIRASDFPCVISAAITLCSWLHWNTLLWPWTIGCTLPHAGGAGGF